MYMENLRFNPTYSSTAVSESEVLDNHTSVLSFFGINVGKDFWNFHIYTGSQKHTKFYCWIISMV